jgi:serine/threonine-protein kinase
MRPTDESQSDQDAPLPDPKPEPGTPAHPAAHQTVDEESGQPSGNGASCSAPESVDRYALLGEVGRGGIGLVLRGHDPRLGRDLALKVLLERHAGQPEVMRRFVEEAQISGQLQHPGVVPVYDLGRFEDGRPFFTMKLVKGQTLARLLAERKEPTQDLPRFLQIFEQVCQTVAYAHSKGVIHRDLKPANVMVGAFGEVQVMDWGLAKVLGQAAENPVVPPTETVSVMRTLRSGLSGSDSQPGSILGTPAYMAPEQALGDVERLDRRCDVFGLGAVLCEILTGHPPYVGPDREAVHRKAARADQADAFARLDGCSAGSELVNLAKRCLAAEPPDRPADAGAVADGMTAYLTGVAERLRRAEVERAAAQARAEEETRTRRVAEEKVAVERQKVAVERRARRLTVGLAAAVLVLVCGGALAGLWWQQQRAERDAEAQRQRLAFEADLNRAAELRQQARWAEARAVLEQTRQRLGEAGSEELRQRLEQAIADLALVDRLEGIRLKRSAIVEGKLDSQGADRDYATTFRGAGLSGEGEEPETVAARLRASAVREHLLAALDDWAAVTVDIKRRAWLLAVARQADRDEWRDRFRDPQMWQNPTGLKALAQELLADNRQLARQKPPLLAVLGAALSATGADAVPLLAAAQALYPDDFWLNFDLGNALAQAKKWDAAIGFYRAAVAVRSSAAAPHLNLGNVFAAQKQYEAAIQEFRIASQLDPKAAAPHNNLGNVFRDQKQYEAAIQEFRTASKLDPKLAWPHHNLGVVFQDQKQYEAAIQEFRTASKLDPKFASPHYNLGNILRDQKQFEAAIQEYRKASELDPKDAKPHNNLGNVFHEQKQYEAAIQEFRTASKLDPKDAVPHFNLGNALHDLQRLEEAIKEYHQAIAIDPKYAKAHCRLGFVFREQGKFSEALASVRRGHELGSRQPGWPNSFSAQLVRDVERLVELDRRLSSILEGKKESTNNAERLALADFCQQPFKRSYATSARFYEEAFTRNERLANNLDQQYRYHAACSAALAGAGQGEDARCLPDKVAFRLRHQALDWLRADLAAYGKLAEAKAADKQMVRQRLTHWRQDGDLVSVRDPEALANLPEPERQAWRQLWDDVAALLKQVESGK